MRIPYARCSIVLYKKGVTKSKPNFYRKKDKLPQPPTAVLNIKKYPGSVRLCSDREPVVPWSRDAGKQAIRIDGIKGIPVKGMTLSLGWIQKNRKCKKRLPTVYTSYLGSVYTVQHRSYCDNCDCPVSLSTMSFSRAGSVFSCFRSENIFLEANTETTSINAWLSMRLSIL